MGSWLKKGDRGPGVRRLQELLLTCKFELPKWGVDGGFGDETEAAVKKAQAHLGLVVDGIAGKKTLTALHDMLSGDEHLVGNIDGLESDIITVMNGVEVHDYRGLVVPPKNGRPAKGDRWPKLSGMVLHRTACRLGENPKRYFKVNAHAHVSLEGRIFLIHPWNLHIWHGHAMSSWAPGIEFDGNPEGYPGYHWKPGGGPDPITDAQVKASKVLLRLIRHEFALNGRNLEYVYGHRQGSDQRECDPGWQAWEKIAIPWMADSGATCGDKNGWGGSSFSSGFVIPKHWDPRSPFGFREQGDR